MIKEEAMVLSMTEKVMAKELAMVWSKMEKVLVWSMKEKMLVWNTKVMELVMNMTKKEIGRMDLNWLSMKTLVRSMMNKTKMMMEDYLTMNHPDKKATGIKLAGEG